MGVVIGAALERMGGVGAVCCSYVDRPFCADAVRSMNLGEVERSVCKTISMAELIQAKKVMDGGQRSQFTCTIL